MIPIRHLVRAGVIVFVVSLLLVFVGVESGCDSGSKGPGMVTDPPPPPPGTPIQEGYPTHKPRAKPHRSRPAR